MKKVFAIFALAVMFFFCGSILLRFTVKNVLIDNGVENKWIDIIFFDAKEGDFVNENKNKVPLFIESPISDFKEAVREKLPLKAEEKIFNSEDYGSNNHNQSRDNFYLKIKKKIDYYTTYFLVFNKVIVKFSNYLLVDKILPNKVIDLGEGYLVEPYPKNSLNIDAIVQKVGYFKHILDSIGIPLVYAQYPDVICYDDEVSKTGKDFTNQAKLELMGKLSQIGVPIIDLTRECRHSLFYKTDHHWRVKTSIWAAQAIIKKLNELYDFDLNVELLDTNNFTEKLVGKWLGSMGEKVIPLYGKENFYIYSPKYATDINWILLENELFEANNVSFDSLYHFVSDTIESKYAYSAAYPGLIFSQNNNLPDGKKILLIGDSYNNSLSKFLALVFKEVNFIQKRSSLLDDYLANKPDVVVLGFSKWVLIFNPETLIF